MQAKRAPCRAINTGKQQSVTVTAGQRTAQVSRPDGHAPYTFQAGHAPSAILIAPEDLEALEETLEIMRDAATMNRLAESDAELARGEFVSAEELAEAMRRRQTK
jgi:PHD/YefM family antitoxin component YafN of YafNO toxin-antitoxin module